MRKFLGSILRAFKAFDYSRSNRNRIARAKKILANQEQPYSLHLGCGAVHYDGWLNIDFGGGPAVDLELDLTWPLPFENDSCGLIYSEHLLEHFDAPDGVNLLKECYRVLKPGGVIRVAMPSLDYLIESSYEGSWKAADWLSWPEFNHISTRAEMLNIVFRSWGHQWLYDREELHRRFNESGFVTIIDCQWGESSLPQLSNREKRKDSILVCEAIK